MTDQQKKQKAIAMAFSRYDRNERSKSTEEAYFDWILTEEGKRLTAEEPEPKESSYDLLVKISGQLDRIEGNMKVVISDDLLKK